MLRSAPAHEAPILALLPLCSLPAEEARPPPAAAPKEEGGVGGGASLDVEMAAEEAATPLSSSTILVSLCSEGSVSPLPPPPSPGPHPRQRISAASPPHLA